MKRSEGKALAGFIERGNLASSTQAKRARRPAVDRDERNGEGDGERRGDPSDRDGMNGEGNGEGGQ